MTPSPETRCEQCGHPVVRAQTDRRIETFDRLPVAGGGWHLRVAEAPVTYERRHDAGSSPFGVRHGTIETLNAERADGGRYRLHAETCTAATLFDEVVA